MIRIYKDSPTKLDILRIAKKIESSAGICSPLISALTKSMIESIKQDKFKQASKYAALIGQGGKAGASTKIAKTKALADGLRKRIITFANQNPDKFNKEAYESEDFSEADNRMWAYNERITDLAKRYEAEASNAQSIDELNGIVREYEQKVAGEKTGVHGKMLMVVLANDPRLKNALENNRQVESFRSTVKDMNKILAEEESFGAFGNLFNSQTSVDAKVKVLYDELNKLKNDNAKILTAAENAVERLKNKADVNIAHRATNVYPAQYLEVFEKRLGLEAPVSFDGNELEFRNTKLGKKLDKAVQPLLRRIIEASNDKQVKGSNAFKTFFKDLRKYYEQGVIGMWKLYHKKFFLQPEKEGRFLNSREFEIQHPDLKIQENTL